MTNQTEETNKIVQELRVPVKTIIAYLSEATGYLRNIADRQSELYQITHNLRQDLYAISRKNDEQFITLISELEKIVDAKVFLSSIEGFQEDITLNTSTIKQQLNIISGKIDQLS